MHRVILWRLTSSDFLGSKTLRLCATVVPVVENLAAVLTENAAVAEL